MKLASLLLLITAMSMPAADSTEEKSVVAAVQKLFDAMQAKDGNAIRALTLPGGQFVSIRADGKVSVTAVEKFAENIAAAKDLLVEKMWDPKVMVQDKIATLWAPYDFHRAGVFSHCGIDAVSLLKVDDSWKIASVTYTTQQQGCASK